jgi:hypothetical protein
MAEDRPDYKRIPTRRSLHEAMQSDLYDVGRVTRDIRELEAAKERAAVEREQAMIKELRAMRAAPRCNAARKAKRPRAPRHRRPA